MVRFLKGQRKLTYTVHELFAFRLVKSFISQAYNFSLLGTQAGGNEFCSESCENGLEKLQGAFVVTFF